ncbi:MAG: hypothetical protein JWM11_5320 [Planctomycetaceae bacterium]|nr:hypothetical protein [Planctomycetaceae bacterium]
MSLGYLHNFADATWKWNFRGFDDPTRQCCQNLKHRKKSSPVAGRLAVHRWYLMHFNDSADHTQSDRNRSNQFAISATAAIVRFPSKIRISWPFETTSNAPSNPNSLARDSIRRFSSCISARLGPICFSFDQDARTARDREKDVGPALPDPRHQVGLRSIQSRL